MKMIAKFFPKEIFPVKSSAPTKKKTGNFLYDQ
jgi:hypothetical protein